MYKPILAAATLAATHAFAAPTQTQSPPGVSLIPDYTPPDWIPTYDHNWCPANASAVYIPPVFAYYPVPPSEVYDIVGSFVNITWVASFFNDTTYVGTDRVPGGKTASPSTTSLALPPLKLLSKIDLLFLPSRPHRTPRLLRRSRSPLQLPHLQHHHPRFLPPASGPPGQKHPSRPRAAGNEFSRRDADDARL